MLELDRILRQIQRRDRVHRLFHATGWCVAIALGAGCLLLLVDRVTGAGLSWGVYAGFAGIGAALGIAGALASGPRLEELAVRMDRLGGLKDRAATAQAIAQGRLRHAELAGLVSADAERAAGGIDVKRIQPVRVGKVWLVVLLLGVGLGMGVRFMPPFDLFGGDSISQAEADEREEALAAEREEAREDVQNVAQEARELLGDGRGQDEAVAALERLSEQFSQRQLTQREMDEARDDAAARLDEVADKLADEARRQEALADELAARFAGLEEREPPMSAKEFAEALQRGDFGKAAEQMEKLRRDPQAMTPEERQAVADYLRSAGETLSQERASDAGDTSQRELDRLEQALRDRGVDEETIQQIREEAANQEQTAERLKQEGVEEEQAERMAREAAAAKDAEEAREQAEREARELSEALERAADQIEHNENKPQESDPNEERGKPQDQQPSGQEDSAKQQDDAAQKQDAAKQSNEAQDGKEQQQGESKQQQQSGGEKQAGQQQGQKQEGAQEQKQDNAGSKQQPGQQQSGQQQQQQGQQQQPAQQQQGGTQEGKQEGKQEGQPQGQESGGEEGGKQEGGERPGGSKSDGGAGADSPMDTPGDPGGSKEKSKQGGAQGGGEGEQPGDSPAQQKPDGGGAGERSDDQRQGGQPGAKEGESGDEKQGGGGEGEAPQQPANAEDVLRRMEQAREAAKRQQEASERAREAARKLADRASERQSDDAGNWADSRSRERGGSGSGGAGEGEGSKATDERGGTFRPDATEGMELGGEEPGSKILAEWLDESKPATPGEARTSTLSGHVERAKRSAEQAVEQTAVPARYHELIRRYFGKGLPAAAERASGGNTEATKPEGTAP